MISRVSLLIGILVGLMLAGCASSEVPVVIEDPVVPVQPTEPVIEEPAPPVPAETEPPQDTQAVPATEVPATEPPAIIATSRGDSLEATDPAGVALASGELQLVEFFRYT